MRFDFVLEDEEAEAVFDAVRQEISDVSEMKFNAIDGCWSDKDAVSTWVDGRVAFLKKIIAKMYNYRGASPVVIATRKIVQRYLSQIESDLDAGRPDAFENDPRLSLKAIAGLCKALLDESNHFEDDKASRWLGFIQGCLAMRSMIDVDQERDATRPLFHEIYANRGVTQKTIVA